MAERLFANVGDRVDVAKGTGLKDPRYKNGWRGTIVHIEYHAPNPGAWISAVRVRPDADPHVTFLVSATRVRKLNLLEEIAEAAQ